MTRFAPAPTGWLHLGHVLNALYVWNTARAAGCRVMLRIEDHDRERCRPEYERGILDDLDWLGFVPDIYPTRHVPGGAGVMAVRATATPSIATRCAGCATGGWSTPATAPAVRWRRAAPRPAPGGEPRYPGTCRDRGLPLADGVGWRVRLRPVSRTFDDALLGRQEQSPASSAATC